MSEKFEKAKKGLACCERRGYCEGHCPYYEPEKEALECTSELAHDALALISYLDERIKELSLMQVARVMTLEEVRNAENCKEPVFVEMLHHHGKADITPDVFSWRFVKHITPLTDGDIYVLQNADINSALFEETYNITWRCWTHRPTDEQREVTPWY